MIALSFGLNSFEQFGVRSFKLIRKLHICFQRFGIYLEAFSQLARGWVIKEGNILVQVRDDQFVT
jgi:hypothetical protein